MSERKRWLPRARHCPIRAKYCAAVWEWGPFASTTFLSSAPIRSISRRSHAWTVVPAAIEPMVSAMVNEPSPSRGGAMTSRSGT